MTAQKKPTEDGVAVIYARYSSHAQKDESIEQQVSECTKYAQECNLSVKRIYADRAMSGTNDNRPEFQRLLKDSASHTFKYVIAWKSNRIGRNMLQAMVNEERLRDNGVRCLYVEEDFEDNASGRFALRTMMNVNQFYSENMAEDIKRGLRDNALNCKVAGGSVPFGYKKNSDLTISVDENRAPYVRELFERIANGETCASVGRDFNARGIRTIYGNEWKKNSFRSMLTNERYKGVYIWQDVRIEGGVPRIVSDELFDRVQLALRTKTRWGRTSKNDYYALAGKVYCGDCGSRMVGVCGTSRNGTVHHYYECVSKRKHCCNSSIFKREALERIVAETVLSKCLTRSNIVIIANKTIEYYDRKEEEAKIGELEKRAEVVDRSLKNMMNAIERGIITPTTRERVCQLEQEKAEIASLIAVARAQLVHLSKEQIIAALEMLRDGDIENARYRNALFDTFIKAVYVYNGKVRIVFSADGNDTADEVISFGSTTDKLSALNCAKSNTLYQYGRLFFFDAKT